MSNKFLIAGVLAVSTLVSFALPGRTQQTTIQGINQNNNINGSGNIVITNAVNNSVNISVSNTPVYPVNNTSTYNPQTSIANILQTSNITGYNNLIINDAKNNSSNYYRGNCSVYNASYICR